MYYSWGSLVLHDVVVLHHVGGVVVWLHVGGVVVLHWLLGNILSCHL